MKLRQVRLITAIGVALCLSGGFMSCKGKSTVIIIEEPTEVVTEQTCSFYKDVEEITTLNKGERVHVLGEKRLKGCLVYKIKLADGGVGYITYEDQFTVIEGQEQ